MNAVALARLKLAQRLVLGAAEVNPALFREDSWQSAMEHITAAVQAAKQNGSRKKNHKQQEK